MREHLFVGGIVFNPSVEFQGLTESMLRHFEAAQHLTKTLFMLLFFVIRQYLIMLVAD